jgi:hypothetical protein
MKVPAYMIQALWRKMFEEAGRKPPILLPVSKKATEEYRYRVACNEAVRSYMTYTINEAGELVTPPKVFFLDRCRSITQTLPMLKGDENDPLDLADKQDDHDYDAFKMPFMQIFAAPTKMKPKSAEEKFQDSNRNGQVAQLSGTNIPQPTDWRTDW